VQIQGRRRRTAISNPKVEHPSDLVKRQFAAIRPNQFWVADFTHVTTWIGLQKG